jgi:hypothetical protein
LAVIDGGAHSARNGNQRERKYHCYVCAGSGAELAEFGGETASKRLHRHDNMPWSEIGLWRNPTGMYVISCKDRPKYVDFSLWMVSEMLGSGGNFNKTSPLQALGQVHGSCRHRSD